MVSTKDFGLADLGILAIGLIGGALVFGLIKLPARAEAIISSLKDDTSEMQITGTETPLLPPATVPFRSSNLDAIRIRAAESRQRAIDRFNFGTNTGQAQEIASGEIIPNLLL